MILHADSISVRTNGHARLHDASLVLLPGQLVLMTGPNGSGKSTFLKALCSLIPVSSGDVFLDGVQASSLSRRDLARRIAYVPQDMGTENDFTVMETVLLGRSPWQNAFGDVSDRDMSIAIQSLGMLNLEGFERRRVRDLSGGERQRVMIARAVAQAPQILLLDEPTSALDYKFQWCVMDVLTRLKSQGVGMLMATHDLNLAGRYAEKAMLLHEGRIICAGAPAAVFSPENLKKAYGCPFAVDVHPASESLRITPLLPR